MASVTVLVSIKNKADTVKLCVESLLRLRYSPLTIMIVEGFDDKDVIATAGYCGTPEGLTGFQKAIGLQNKGKVVL